MRHRTPLPGTSGITVMTDLYEFESPSGRLGRFANEFCAAPGTMKKNAARTQSYRHQAGRETDQWKKHTIPPTPSAS
jgi:hypothetical protein